MNRFFLMHKNFKVAFSQRRMNVTIKIIDRYLCFRRSEGFSIKMINQFMTVFFLF